MSVDEEGICVGLGSSGDLEFWNRRTNERVWRYRVPRGGGNIFLAEWVVGELLSV